MDLHELAQELSSLKEKGRYRFLRRLSTPQDARITIDGRELLNFSSNNYLGLAKHPEVVAAFTASAQHYGVGSGASRLISGHMEIHAQLEEALARFKGAEACLTFSSGYLANLGILATLAGPEAVIFSDELNHASIVDGCRIARARVEVYRHGDPGHLERLVKDCTARRKIIVTDGVFSMDGDIAPLPELVGIKEKYGAALIVDDAHATGVLPPRGAGSAEYFGLSGRVEIQMGTLSKALGTYGAYLCASREIVDYLINKCRTFIFNTGLPPAIAGATVKSLEILSRTGRLGELWRNQESLRQEMEARGWKISSPSAIVPFLLGDDRKTMAASRALYERGLFLQGIRPPTVPEGKGRLRLTLMATHTPEMIRTAAGLLDECLQEMGIEPH